MNAHAKQTAVKELLRAHFRNERATDFSLLRQVPSTEARKFLDYFSSLDGAGKEALAEAMAQAALPTFFPYDCENPYQAGDPAYKRYVGAAGRMHGWRYQSVRDSARVNVAQMEGAPYPFFPVTNEIKSWLEKLRPSKATEIRRGVKLALSQLIIPLQVSHEGSLWRYSGSLRERHICINISYNQKYSQLAHGIEHPYQDRRPGKLRLDIGYERLLGLECAWDCLEQANLDQSMALLKELVLHCAKFLESLPECPL